MAVVVVVDVTINAGASGGGGGIRRFVFVWRGAKAEIDTVNDASSCIKETIVVGWNFIV